MRRTEGIILESDAGEDEGDIVEASESSRNARPTDPQPAMIAVQRVLPDTLSEIVRRQPLTQDKVDFAWRTAVGSALARVSSARLDGHGTLRVRTDDERWTREIERGRDVIRARLDRLLGEDLKRVEVGGPRNSQNSQNSQR
jgi:hypothetical protein